MIILSIETSCDETAVSLVKASGDLHSPIFKILGNALFSQIDIHKEYGGVYPAIAKREHQKKLPSLLKKVLEDGKIYKETKIPNKEKWKEVENILAGEFGKEKILYEGLKNYFEKIEKPDIDVISVTAGPGLEPALWVGVNCAAALGKLWDIPVVSANHMEGHIASVMIENEKKIEFPTLALLISGGHTELVEIKKWGDYKIVGETLDDAVGEAFDKVARMLSLPYPGGPEISKLAEKARKENLSHVAKFPRPMINSNNLNFSFSGLKTAVLYYIRDNFQNKVLSEEDKMDIAREFEDTVVDVLSYKTEKALKDFGAKTLIIAGGVIANKKLREVFFEFEKKFAELNVLVPAKNMSTDNALMIACATYINVCLYPEILRTPKKIIANGNLRLGISSPTL